VDRSQLEKLLADVRAGTVAPGDAAKMLTELPYVEAAQDLFVDTQRELRTGIPEIVYAAGKTPEQVADAMDVLSKETFALATRCDKERCDAVISRTSGRHFKLDTLAQTIMVGPTSADVSPKRPPCAPIAIVSGGTSDHRVVAEVASVAEFLGAPVQKFQDVGIAGLHRLLARLEYIKRCEVIVAVAGMEAALPSVLAGLVDKPIIAVPTSIGYGVSLDGLVALGALLSSCAPGITVVNIDNGVGAAVAAVKIARLAVRP